VSTEDGLAPGTAGPGGPGPDGRRRLVIWMHSDRHPTWRIPDGLVEAIRETAGPDWSVEAIRVPAFSGGDGAGRAPAPVLAAVAEAEVYFGFGITPEIFGASPRLRWAHSGAAGVRGSLFPAMREADVVLTNSAGVYADPLGEWAIATMLHFARGFDLAIAGNRNGGWPYEALAGERSPLRELAGGLVAVVGYGGIGRAVGMRAAALGMRVWAVRARPGRTPLPEVERQLGPEALCEALEAADFVILALPETSDTKDLLGARELARMRPDAVLMNLSRGGIVDEAALADALRAGALRGAALDVFREEPLPPESPLRELDNVLITPHTGSITPRFWERQGALMLRNIGHWKAGRPLENRVDKERGY
jgi:phosphoglycerate dehydrogenase-like enzyme